MVLFWLLKKNKPALAEANHSYTLKSEIHGLLLELARDFR